MSARQGGRPRRAPEPAKEETVEMTERTDHVKGKRGKKKEKITKGLKASRGQGKISFD